MTLIDWFKSLYSRRAKSLLSYRRGMHKAKLGDYKGAISDYTQVIETGNVPNDVWVWHCSIEAWPIRLFKKPRRPLLI